MAFVFITYLIGSIVYLDTRQYCYGHSLHRPSRISADHSIIRKSFGLILIKEKAKYSIDKLRRFRDPSHAKTVLC